MGFESCHPAINLIYFVAVVAGTVMFQHPVFLGISVLCAFTYSIKRNGRKALVFDGLLLPLVAVFAAYYSSYTHFGVTVLERNLIGNNMTLEALVYGFVLGLAVAGVIAWFSCVFSVFASDKVGYLLGRLSPRLSLFMAILLRMIPRIKKEAKKINCAQQGIGRGANQGNILGRLCNCVRIISILITWTVESLICVSRSMDSRGGTLRGRTAFSIYRFDDRDRLLVLGMFACLTFVMMGAMLKQTNAIYDPKILLPPVSALSYVFYGAYTIFCLVPLTLELWSEYRFRRAIAQI